MLILYSQLRQSIGEFQALQLIFLGVFGAVDGTPWCIHLPAVCLPTFKNLVLKDTSLCSVNIYIYVCVYHNIP